MITSPLITVVIPTHNRPAFLRQAVRSVLSQTLLPSEIVVSEDGECVGTHEVISEARQHGIKVQHLLHKKKVGQLANRQFGIRAATGTYVAMLDDDDIWEPEFLSKTSQILDSNPDCGFVWTDHFVMDQEGEVLLDATTKCSSSTGRTRLPDGRYTNTLEMSLKTWPYSLQHTLFRRKELERVNYFPQYSGTSPDLALFMVLGVNNVAGYYVSSRLGRCRIHPGQQTIKRVENSLSQVTLARDFAGEYWERLSIAERRILINWYRSRVVELCIAEARIGERRNAIRDLSWLRGFGVGPSNFSRLLVFLIALLVG